MLKKHTEQPKSNFTVLPNRLAQGLGSLSDSAFRVYVFLYSQSEKYNPSIGGLSHMIYNKGHPKSRATIERAIAEIEEARLLKVVQTGPKSSEWHLYSDPHKEETEEV